MLSGHLFVYVSVCVCASFTKLCMLAGVVSRLTPAGFRVGIGAHRGLRGAGRTIAMGGAPGVQAGAAWGGGEFGGDPNHVRVLCMCVATLAVSMHASRLRGSLLDR